MQHDATRRVCHLSLAQELQRVQKTLAARLIKLDEETKVDSHDSPGQDAD